MQNKIMEYPETIQEYLQSMHCNIIPFIKKVNGIISGSTVLYYYMKENGLNPTFTPGDIDIYYLNNNKIDRNNLDNIKFLDFSFDTTIFNLDIRGNPSIFKKFDDYENITNILGYYYKTINNVKFDFIVINENRMNFINTPTLIIFTYKSIS
jgi:hypothetical protein